MQRTKTFSVEHKDVKIKKILLRIVLYYCLFTSLLYNAIVLLIYFPGPHIIKLSGSANSCYILFQISAVIWVSNKTCLFYGYFLRLDYIYKGTEHEIPKWILIIFYILFIGNFIVWLCIIHLLCVPTDFQFNEKYGFCEQIPYIQSPVNTVLSGVVIMFELIVSVIALILYLRPLCHLKRMENDRDLHDKIINIGLLNSIIILSSNFCIIIWVTTTSALFFFIDNVINSLCLILMTNIHKRLYERICCLCLCYRCCQYHVNQQREEVCTPTSPQSDTNYIPKPNLQARVTVVTNSFQPREEI